MGDAAPASTSSPSSRAAAHQLKFVGPGMTVLECQDIIEDSLEHDPKVKFLVESIEKSGCRIGTDFIQAVRCGYPCSGAFEEGVGIEICANFANYKDEVVQTMIHELIHAYDHCRAANMMWESSTHQACTEIRANNLSGNCHILREILRGHLGIRNLKIKGHEPACVKQRAMASVAAQHSPEVAKAAVEAVWDTCYNDTAPFDRIP